MAGIVEGEPSGFRLLTHVADPRNLRWLTSCSSWRSAITAPAREQRCLLRARVSRSARPWHRFHREITRVRIRISAFGKRSRALDVCASN